MKFNTPINPNYCASVVKIKALTPLQGCDNVVGTPIFGFQAIVNKSTQLGDIGIVLPVETQLSEQFCFENNLYRHQEQNKDTEAKGYIEDNRRVRSVKFRGHRSDCLFMPLESLSFTGIDISELQEGDEFDFINDTEICRKYVVFTREPKAQKEQEKKFQRVEDKYMPQHIDSDNYFKFKDMISPLTDVIITQKLHGTSIRIANTIVKRKFTILDRIAKVLRVNVQETETDYVFGSRKVIKDINNPDQNHYYETDIWTQEGKKLEGLLPENFIVYGELIGWTPTGAPIQEGYTYALAVGTCELYIYRVSFVNSQGLLFDLSWDHLKEFCISRGLKYVPELFKGQHQDFDAQKFMDKRYQDEGYEGVVPLSDETGVDEGVCLRVDTIIPSIYKAKAPKFLEHETKLLDKGQEDLESQESTV